MRILVRLFLLVPNESVPSGYIYRLVLFYISVIMTVFQLLLELMRILIMSIVGWNASVDETWGDSATTAELAKDDT